jgi:hypothetical protein
MPNVCTRTNNRRIGVHATATGNSPNKEENDMSIGTIILIVLVLVLIGALPTWPHSSGWGYGPSGGIGLIVVILLILVLLGKI